MRATRLITVSTMAVLMFGTSWALGQAGGTASMSERGKAISSERGRAVSGERGKALTAERGRAVSGERGQAMTAERGRAMETTGSSEQQRMRLHDILSARRDIPRAPRVAAGAIRVDAIVPRGVRLAAVPGDIARI